MAKPSMKRVAEGIYRRPTGKYVVPVYDPQIGRKVYSWPGMPRGGFDSLEAAKDFKRAVEREKKTRGTSQETCDHFAKRWPRDFPRREESTNIHNRERVKTFSKDFKDRPLSGLSKAEAREWALAHPGSLKAVRAMFADAARDGLVGENPFANLGLPRSNGREDILVLTESELAGLVQAAEQVWGDFGEQTFGPMIVVAAYTGFRPGELYALRWPWVDFDSEEITPRKQLQQKTGRLTTPKGKRGSQTITLLPQAAAALRRAQQVRSLEHDYVFTNQSGERLQQRTHHYYWKSVRAAFWGGLPAARQEEIDPGFDFYELRHFYGTHLANDWGLSPFEIADQMRHDDNGVLASTLYVHPQSKDVRARFRKRIHDRAMGLEREAG